MWIVGRCIVCTRIRLLLLSCPFISSFFFLSNYQTLNIFITFFWGTGRSRTLKLGTHMDSGWMYGVYQNQAAAAYSSLYFFFLQYSNIKIFVTLFSGTVRHRRLKLDANVDNGWMYSVYQNQVAAAYLSLYIFIFLSLQFSNIKMLKQYKVINMKNKYNVLCILKSGCSYFFISLFLPFSVSLIFSLY